MTSGNAWIRAGSPIILFNPGEQAAASVAGMTGNITLPGLIAQAVAGAIVVMEHRYFGNSLPFQDLNAKTLQYLTLNNSIYDAVNFAQNVQLDFDAKRTSTPSKAPWILIGSSYGGALAAWTAEKAPGTFWAYHSSSAPLQAVDYFWEYFVGTQKGMPRNCSVDVSKVVDHVDNILASTKPEKKQALKERFDLGGLSRDDDFAAALQKPIFLWQTNSFTTGYSEFYQFCDYVENVHPGSKSVAPGVKGVGAALALDGYSKWMTEVFVPGYCANLSVNNDTAMNDLSCFDSHNSSNPQYTDKSAQNVFRTWNWLLCNEPLNFWQTGAPKGKITIVSRLLTPKYFESQCSLYFPCVDGFTYGSAKGKTIKDVNRFTGGWNIGQKKRVMFVNGEFDPWLAASVTSTFRPGGSLYGSRDIPVEIIPKAIHGYDMATPNGDANLGVRAVQNKAVAQMKAWVAEFHEREG